ncbi:MAG: rod shape-determining protein MreD [Nitrospirae bacterium]|nr:rod shape-determining protein MreD [Nitrospirota bacterium]
MNRWIYFMIILLLVPVQTTWLHGISLHSVKPNLPLLLVYFTGFYAGEINGLAAGLATGMMLDFFSGGPLGLTTAVQAMVGLLSGLLGRFFLNITAILTMGIVFLLSIFSGMMVFFFHQWLLGGVVLMDAFRWTMLPEALYNTVAGGMLFWAGMARLNTVKHGTDPSPFRPRLG